MNLPANLWAKILDLIDFDDVLNCSIVNRFFLDDVSPLIRRLFVRESANLLGSAARRRYSGVEEIYVYTFVDDAYVSPEDGLRRNPYIAVLIDIRTASWIVGFLTSFPKLRFASLSGEDTWDYGFHRWDRRHKEKIYIADKVSIGYEFDLRHTYDDESETEDERENVLEASNMVTLQICEAYSSGALSQSVSIRGVPPQGCWKYENKRRSTRDQNCSICHMVCRSFPPLDVMDEQKKAYIPCVSQLDRNRIAFRRDPEAVRSKLTDFLLESVKYADEHLAILPPDSPEKQIWPSYSEEKVEHIQWLIDHGADVRDIRIRTLLTVRPSRDVYERDPSAYIGWKGPEEVEWSEDCQKRLFDLELFRILVGLGMDLYESDFELMDSNKIERECKYRNRNYEPIYGRTVRYVMVREFEGLRT